MFAHTYRNKHLTGSPSGLRELMGCDDRVMYLISEISCLESLKLQGHLDDMTVCTHITALAQQLDATEPGPGAVTYPYSSTGSIRPRQLSRNMSALFRIAARVYLCSLVVGYDKYQPSTCNLIANFAELLEFIPSGPDGFDRSLVWPFLICGAFSVPTSPFRSVFQTRIARLGEQAEFGSFGRVVRLLEEVWNQSDATVIKTEPGCTPTPISATSTPLLGVEGSDLTKTKSVHWRDVMQQNGWDFLLI